MLDASVLQAMSTEHLIETLRSTNEMNEIEKELLSRLEFTYHELEFCLDIVSQIKTVADEVEQ